MGRESPQAETQVTDVQRAGPSHQPSSVLLEFVDNSDGMGSVEGVANDAVMECSELTHFVPVMPALNSEISSSSSSSLSCRKRRRTFTESSGQSSESETSLIKILEEKNKLTKRKLALEELKLEVDKQKVELEKERIAIERKRFELQCEQSKIMCNSVTNVFSSICAAIQMAVEYFTSQRLQQ